MTIQQHSSQFKNVYFPNLNGLRFIAAMMVFVCHIEGIKTHYINTDYTLALFPVIGKLGVVLFFVISGFLITYLLLLEEKNTSTISIKKFYTRRILRIWPLYFLIVLLSLFVFPKFHLFHIPNYFDPLSIPKNFTATLLFFLFFLPNMVVSAFGCVPYATQTWSIGTEEQFYLVWPVLIKKIKNRPLLFISVFVGYILIKIILHLLEKFNPIFTSILYFLEYCNIDIMALGALAAYLVFTKKENILTIINNKAVQIINLLILVSLISIGYMFPYLHYEIFAVFFSVLLLNLVSGKSLLNLENNVLFFLGKISYGIYMYHFIIMQVAIKFLLHFNIYNNLLFYLLSFTGTILMATISYYSFERYFLNLKSKF